MYMERENSTKVRTALSKDDSIDDSIRSHVSFDDRLEVRWYDTVLGDNPSVSDGPPVSIGWEFTSEKLSLAQSPQCSKPKHQYHLDASARIERLFKYGVSQREMDKVYAEINYLQRLKKINAAILRGAEVASLPPIEPLLSPIEPLEAEDFGSDYEMPLKGSPPSESSSESSLYEDNTRILPKRTKSDSDLVSVRSTRGRSFFHRIHKINTAILRRAYPSKAESASNDVRRTPPAA